MPASGAVAHSSYRFVIAGLVLAAHFSVVWGFFVTISGAGMFVAPLVVGAARDVAGSFIPGFAIFAVGTWFLALAGVALPRVSRVPA